MVRCCRQGAVNLVHCSPGQAGGKQQACKFQTQAGVAGKTCQGASPQAGSPYRVSIKTPGGHGSNHLCIDQVRFQHQGPVGGGAGLVTQSGFSIRHQFNLLQDAAGKGGMPGGRVGCPVKLLTQGGKHRPAGISARQGAVNPGLLKQHGSRCRRGRLSCRHRQETAAQAVDSGAQQGGALLTAVRAQPDRQAVVARAGFAIAVKLKLNF